MLLCVYVVCLYAVCVYVKVYVVFMSMCSIYAVRVRCVDS